MRRSHFLRFFWASACLLASSSCRDSSSLTRASSLPIVFFVALSAFPSTSSSLTWSSLTWTSNPFLICPQFVSKSSRVDHGLLRFFFRVPGFIQHLIQVSVQSLEFSFQFPLGKAQIVRHCCLRGHRLISIRQFSLSLSSASV